MRRLLFVLLLFFATSLRAESRIVRLNAQTQAGSIAVAFALQNGFDTPQIVRSLQSGMATGFTYRIELVRKRPNWFDKTMSTATIDVVCTYNAQTREYLLNYRRDRKLVRSETFRDFALVTERMTNISEPELLRLSNPRTHKYRVRVRAEMGPRVALFVVPSDVTTEWAETRVRSGGDR